MKKTLFILMLVAIFSSTIFLFGCVDTTFDGGIELPSQQPPTESEGNEQENIFVGEDFVSDAEEAEKDGQEDGEVEEETDTFVRFDILLQSKTNGLNVRAEPKSSAKSLGTLKKGQYVSFQGESNGWYITYYKQKKAYVSASYCEVVQIPLGNEKSEKVIDEGKMLLGYPYIWGSQRYHWGNGKLNTSFKQGEYDCSALTQYAFYKGAGVLLGLTTREQVVQGKKIGKQDIQRGDLLFFTNSSRKHLTGVERVGHVAIYLGENIILHTASDYACIEIISATRWSYFISASRF